MDIALLDKKIEQYCAEKHVTCVVRVTIKDKIVYEKPVGYADNEKKIPFTNNSVFTFYSMTKQLTTFGIMKLKDKGLLSLSDHPSKYVPEAKKLNKNITIENLLRHESGIPDFLFEKSFAEKYAPGTPDKIREHLSLISEYPQYFEPKKGFRYSNVNFSICALIIETLSGKAFKDYMKEEVFEPLGMKTALVDEVGLFVENRVMGHAVIDGEFKAVGKSLNWMFGAGDVIGTIDDVYCLNKAIKNKLLVSEESWKEILTGSPLSDMGMGCYLSDWHGKFCVSHTGGHVGFRLYHAQVLQDDFDWIIMSNSESPTSRHDISEIIHEFFYGEDGKDQKRLAMDAGYI